LKQKFLLAGQPSCRLVKSIKGFKALKAKIHYWDQNLQIQDENYTIMCNSVDGTAVKDCATKFMVVIEMTTKYCGGMGQ